MKKSIAIIIALVLTAAAVGAVVLGVSLTADRSSPVARALGLNDLRDYIGSQIVGVVNAHLVPQIAFETIDYEAPGTVRLGGVTLTAPSGDRVIDVSTLVVTLAEIPERGKAIRIARVEVEGGRVNLSVDPETGSIRGMRPLVKGSGDDPGGASQAPVPENLRLSRVLVLEEIKITDLDLVYDDGSGADPLTLSGFHLAMDIVPATDASAEAPGGQGWYELAFTSGRRPGLELDVEGRLNIDTLMLWTRRAEATIDLSPGTVSTLPPALAELLREHDVRGRAQASFSGSVPLRDPLSGQAGGSLSMTDASFASGEFRLPVDRLGAEVVLGEGALNLSRLDASLLGGSLQATGGTHLTEQSRPAQLSLTITDVDLERLLRATTPAGQDPSLAGLLSATVNATGSLRDREQLAGAGTLKVRDGILVRTPGLSAVAQAAEVGSLTKPGQRTHKADIEFDLVPEGAKITASRLETPTMLARGVGLVGFDRSLDLRVNAGPLEKLQGMLGQAGKLIGKLTDQLVTYRVTGTISEPSVSVAPLGIEVAP